MKGKALVMLAICLFAVGRVAWSADTAPKAPDPVKAPPLALIAPAGGEHFAFESKTEISWALAGIKPVSYEIMLSADGGLTWSEKLAALNGADAAVSKWTWSKVSPVGEKFRIKVTARTLKESYEAISEIFAVVAGANQVEIGNDPRIDSPGGQKPGETKPTPAPTPGHPTPKKPESPTEIGINSAGDPKPGETIPTPAPTPGNPTPKKPETKQEVTANSAGGQPPAGGGESIVTPQPVPGGPAPKALELTTPNGGEVWKVGESVKVTWTCSAKQETFSLQLSTDGGKSYKSIAEKLPGSEMIYQWTVKGDVSKSCLIKVAAGSAMTVVLEDVSDKAFEIVNPKIAKEAPKAK